MLMETRRPLKIYFRANQKTNSYERNATGIKVILWKLNHSLTKKSLFLRSEN